jgi:hypothetical protein
VGDLRSLDAQLAVAAQELPLVRGAAPAPAAAAGGQPAGAGDLQCGIELQHVLQAAGPGVQLQALLGLQLRNCSEASALPPGWQLLVSLVPERAPLPAQHQLQPLQLPLAPGGSLAVQVLLPLGLDPVTQQPPGCWVQVALTKAPQHQGQAGERALLLLQQSFITGSEFSSKCQGPQGLLGSLGPALPAAGANSSSSSSSSSLRISSSLALLAPSRKTKTAAKAGNGPHGAAAAAGPSPPAWLQQLQEGRQQLPPSLGGLLQGAPRFEPPAWLTALQQQLQQGPAPGPAAVPAPRASSSIAGSSWIIVPQLQPPSLPLAVARSLPGAAAAAAGEAPEERTVASGGLPASAAVLRGSMGQQQAGMAKLQLDALVYEGLRQLAPVPSQACGASSSGRDRLLLQAGCQAGQPAAGPGQAAMSARWTEPGAAAWQQGAAVQTVVQLAAGSPAGVADLHRQLLGQLQLQAQEALPGPGGSSSTRGLALVASRQQMQQALQGLKDLRARARALQAQQLQLGELRRALDERGGAGGAGGEAGHQGVAALEQRAQQLRRELGAAFVAAHGAVGPALHLASAAVSS